MLLILLLLDGDDERQCRRKKLKQNSWTNINTGRKYRESKERLQGLWRKPKDKSTKAGGQASKTEKVRKKKRKGRYRKTRQIMLVYGDLKMVTKKEGAREKDEKKEDEEDEEDGEEY